MPAPNPTAAILIIGNEILSGRTQDVNVHFIAKRLADLGIKLQEVRVVPDVAPRIIDAVNELRAAYDMVFTTGGIGPTHDDITSECIAEAFGVPWEIHAETFAAMEAMMGGEFQRRPPAHGDDAARRRADRQCRVAGAGFLHRQCACHGGRAAHHAVDVRRPGTDLPRGAPIAMRAVHGIGVMEGSIAAGLSAIQDRFPELDLGSYPFRRETVSGVAIVAKGTDVPAIEAAIAEATDLIAAPERDPGAGRAARLNRRD